MTALSVIRILNALMSVGIQYVSLKKMLRTLEEAQEQGRDITPDEWEKALADMDDADARLARAISEAEARRKVS